MYQLKVRIAGDAWQIFITIASTILCTLAILSGLFSPLGMIGTALMIASTVTPLAAHGSWDRHYYSAIATFPVMAFAMMCANTAFQPLASTTSWPSLVAAAMLIMVIVGGRHIIFSHILAYIDKHEYDRHNQNA